VCLFEDGGVVFIDAAELVVAVCEYSAFASGHPREDLACADCRVGLAEFAVEWFFESEQPVEVCGRKEADEVDP
jgi:hypothetical protein